MNPKEPHLLNQHEVLFIEIVGCASHSTANNADNMLDYFPDGNDYCIICKRNPETDNYCKTCNIPTSDPKQLRTRTHDPEASVK